MGTREAVYTGQVDAGLCGRYSLHYNDRGTGCYCPVVYL